MIKNKPNVPDFRNSRVKHLIDVLISKGAKVYGHDPYFSEEVKPWFDCCYVEDTEGEYDIRIIGTVHEEYKKIEGERIY